MTRNGLQTIRMLENLTAFLHVNKRLLIRDVGLSDRAAALFGRTPHGPPGGIFYWGVSLANPPRTVGTWITVTVGSASPSAIAALSSASLST